MDQRPDLFDLSGQVALITGGARGIGLAIAEALGQYGAHTCIADVQAGRAEAAAERLRSGPTGASAYQTDVTRSSDVEGLIESVCRDHGRLDVVVNNAGMSARIPAENYPDGDLERMIDLNLKGVFYVMRSAARRWIDWHSRGRIINLASFAGLVADPLSAPYAATKGAVVQLTRTTAVEWAPYGIAVNAIAPGYVRTEMTAATLSDPKVAEAIRLKTPMGRVADPSEIASAALFLASRASSYVTGHVLCVDGGWTAL